MVNSSSYLRNIIVRYDQLAAFLAYFACISRSERLLVLFKFSSNFCVMLSISVSESKKTLFLLLANKLAIVIAASILLSSIKAGDF